MSYRKILLILFAFLLAGCGGAEEATGTPTLSADEIQTQAVETFSAALTQTALAAPTDTPFPTLTASATFELLATITGGTSAAPPPAASTTSCYQLRFMADVTIPDNTPMAPGQAFTKTWKVANTGSCAWDAGFKFAFVGGEAMGGTTYTLSTSVPGGNGTLDIPIAMTAPTNKTGTLRGNWRMSTAAGQFFGDEVYVQIIVGGATGTPVTATNTSGTSSTATASPTSTATPTNTP